MKKKFYICRTCGNLVELLHDAGVPIMCCGKKMEELVPNTSDGAGEKHVPVVKAEGDKVHVHVGEVTHPMEEKHFIQWVLLETESTCQKKHFKPGEEPSATFILGEEKPIAVYEYCNLHGLWKVEVK